MSNVTSTCGRRGSAGCRQLNLPMVRLSLSHLALALEHVDLDRGLVSLGGRKDSDFLVGSWYSAG